MKSIDRVCLLLYRLWAMLVKRSIIVHNPDLYEIYRQFLPVTLCVSHAGENINYLSQPWSLWNLQTAFVCYSICEPCWWKDQLSFTALISIKSTDSFCLLLYMWAMLVKRSTIFHSPDLYEIYRQLLSVTLYVSHAGEKINYLPQPWSLWNLQTAFACYSICGPCWWKDQLSFTALISMKSTDSFRMLLYMWAMLVKRSTTFHSPDLYEIYRQLSHVTLYVGHAVEKINYLSQPWSLWNLQTAFACYSICEPCWWKDQLSFTALISMKSTDSFRMLLYMWAMLVKRSIIFHSPDLYEIYRQLSHVTLYVGHAGEKINYLSQPWSLWNLQTAFACYSICGPCWWKDQLSSTALISMKSTDSFCLLLYMWAMLVKRSTIFHSPDLYEIYRQLSHDTLYVGHAGEKINYLPQPWSLWNLQTAFVCYSICEPCWWKDQLSFTALISMKSTDSFRMLLYMWAMLVKRSTIFHSPDLYEIYRQLLSVTLYVGHAGEKINYLPQPWSLWNLQTAFACYSICGPCWWKDQLSFRALISMKYTDSFCLLLYMWAMLVKRSTIFQSPDLYEIYRQLLSVTLYVGHAGEKINYRSQPWSLWNLQAAFACYSISKPCWWIRSARFHCPVIYYQYFHIALFWRHVGNTVHNVSFKSTANICLLHYLKAMPF